MAESTTIRTKRDGQIALLDNGGANTYTVAYEPGDFSFDVPHEGVNLFLDRGVIGATPSVRYGDQQPMSFSFSCHLRDVGDTAAGYATLPDICHPYASGYVETTWVSTLGANAEPFVVTCQLTIDGTAFGEADKTLAFAYCSIRGSGSEGDPNTYNVSGTSYQLRPVLS